MTETFRRTAAAAMLLLAFAHPLAAAAQEFREGRVAAVQHRLALLGYDPGPSDGIVGPRTRAAIRAFQRETGLPEDGRLSERLEAALSRTGPAATGGSENHRMRHAIWLSVMLLAVLLFFWRRGRTRAPRKPPPPKPLPRPEAGSDAAAARQTARVRQPPASRIIAGKAYVTDGDGIRESWREIRFAGLDAPEWDQWAKHGDDWFRHGRRVKSALIRKIGGRWVEVTVEKYDKYGRAVGTVACNGEDIGAWLVRNGHAIAAYGERYKEVEREARRERRGLWDYDVAFDPRYWRHGRKKRDEEGDE